MLDRRKIHEYRLRKGFTSRHRSCYGWHTRADDISHPWYSKHAACLYQWRVSFWKCSAGVPHFLFAGQTIPNQPLTPCLRNTRQTDRITEVVLTAKCPPRIIWLHCAAKLTYIGMDTKAGGPTSALFTGKLHIASDVVAADNHSLLFYYTQYLTVSQNFIMNIRLSSRTRQTRWLQCPHKRRQTILHLSVVNCLVSKTDEPTLNNLRLDYCVYEMISRNADV